MSQNSTNGSARVVPRWEWRAFIAGELPAPLRERLAEPTDPPSESDETYILSRRSPHNVKIRGNRLEIKTLEDSDRGLQRWNPTLRTSFPVDRPAIDAAALAWGIAPPPMVPSPVDAGAFLYHVVERSPVLRVVGVRKRRWRLRVGGCAAEHAELDVGGARWHTIAVEDADADRVLRAVASLGLGARANLSYPAALWIITASSNSPASRPGAALDHSGFPLLPRPEARPRLAAKAGFYPGALT
jgi:hypothetical protein